MTDFDVRYGTRAGPFLGLLGLGLLGLGPLGLGRCFSRATVEDGVLRVRMGSAFHGAAPLARVRHALPGPDVPVARGVHVWRGRWLVNGAGSGIVEIGLEPPMLARAAGVPLRVRSLSVSVDDPGVLISALRAAA